MKKPLFLFLLLAFIPTSHAIDGNALKEWCHQVIEKAPGVDPMTFRDGYCMGMTEGVVALSRQRSLQAFCAPERLGGNMLLRTLLDYLDKHPEKLKNSAETLVLEALGETYPCQPPVPAQDE